MERQQHPRHDRARGFALIAVLWLLALLTLLATSASLLSVTHRRAADRLAQALRLDALCDSALRVVLLRLVAPRQQQDRIQIGTPLFINLPAGSVPVTLERDAGKLDLNTAPEELFYALFASSGWPEQQALAMARRILDWRDADDEPQPDGGAERAQYLQAGLGYGPRNGPFRSVAELRQVLGAADIPTQQLQAFTVYTHASQPSLSAAVPAIAETLQYADARHLGGHGWLPNTASSPGGAAATSHAAPDSSVNISALAGEVVTLRGCTQAGSVARCRIVTVRLTGNARKPWLTYLWETQVQ